MTFINKDMFGYMQNILVTFSSLYYLKCARSLLSGIELLLEPNDNLNYSFLPGYPIDFYFLERLIFIFIVFQLIDYLCNSFRFQKNSKESRESFHLPFHLGPCLPYY